MCFFLADKSSSVIAYIAEGEYISFIYEIKGQIMALPEHEHFRV